VVKKEGNDDNETLTDQSGENDDSDIAAGRQHVFMSETPSANKECKTRAQWESNIRKVRGRTYSCTVLGYRNQEGNLWKPGDLVFVEDAYCGIAAEMRINDVVFMMGNTGSLTSLRLLAPNAYLAGPEALETGKEQKIGVGRDGEA
jgi:prophage tail gpP-like protein